MGELVKVMQDWENGNNQDSEEDRLVWGMYLILIVNRLSWLSAF